MIDFDAFKAKYQHAPVKEYPNRVCEVMPEPVVSVHVSTYQHADFIQDCLDGVLMQETDFPFEIIIGEDESDDGTREICKEYADQHPDQIRLFLHRRENNIAIHGRPTGRFQFTYSHFMARGKYIAICEGDDYWTDPLKLQKQVDFLEANPEFVASHHDAKIVNEAGQQIESSKLSDDRKRDWSRGDLQRGSLMLTVSVCCRNAIEDYPVRYFEVLNGDIFLFSLLGEYGRAKYQSEIQPAAYRKHKGGMWSERDEKYTTYHYGNTMLKLGEYHTYVCNDDIADHYLGRALWCYGYLQLLSYRKGQICEFLRASSSYIHLCLRNKKIRLAIGNARESVKRLVVLLLNGLKPQGS